MTTRPNSDHGRSVIFLFNCPRERDLDSPNAYPAHNYLVYRALQAQGMPTTYVKCPARIYSWMRSHQRAWMVYSNLAAAVASRRGTARAVIATQEHTGALLLLLRRLRLVAVPVIIVNVALLRSANRDRRLRRLVWSWLLRCADCVVSFSSGQLPLMGRHFGVEAGKQVFIPLGVDLAFLHLNRAPARKEALGLADADGPPPLILAVGVDEARDYQTLIRSVLRIERVRLEIFCGPENGARITARFGELPARVRVMSEITPYADICRRYGCATIGVIPVRDVMHSSGQTVLLEMMANALPVIVTSCVATSDYVVDGKNAVLVAPADTDALTDAITLLLGDPVVARQLGDEAADTVSRNFTLEMQASRFASLLERLS